MLQVVRALRSASCRAKTFVKRSRVESLGPNGCIGTIAVQWSIQRSRTRDDYARVSVGSSGVRVSRPESITLLWQWIAANSGNDSVDGCLLIVVGIVVWRSYWIWSRVHEIEVDILTTTKSSNVTRQGL